MNNRLLRDGRSLVADRIRLIANPVFDIFGASIGDGGSPIFFSACSIAEIKMGHSGSSETLLVAGGLSPDLARARSGGCISKVSDFSLLVGAVW